jgi:hypothetical protein
MPRRAERNRTDDKSGAPDRLSEIVTVLLKLDVTSFGVPVAYRGYPRRVEEIRSGREPGIAAEEVIARARRIVGR